MAKIAAFFVEGGFWMIPVGCVSFMVAAIAVERVIFLFFKYNIDGKQFMDQVEKLVKANNVDRAVKLCNAAPSAALATVVKAGLTRANKGEAEIIAGVDTARLLFGASRTKGKTFQVNRFSFRWPLHGYCAAPALSLDPVYVVVFRLRRVEFGAQMAPCPFKIFGV